ncbi:DUF6716 putative glycosyltransferase [Testudinibacter sp. TR-2022]|uniref:DUF6716 putative glycosyltransferase n=1 Tax=Testudinibacter sp. TR-2022 TaxID=2585029 RepID=UPI001117F698|nr:DUF6716 putative glycosyltransferase [Testudinibacter sp. TR-2022]TNH22272.1 hypothetical protein FHQ29_07955 [Testudinibacter sp. TR-2022]
MLNKILVIATYDSFLRSAIKLAERIYNFEIDIGILYVKDNQISIRQLQEAGAIKYNVFNIDRLLDKDYLQYDIIILSVGNIAARNFIKKFYKEILQESVYLNNRPILISIFPGIILGNTDVILSRIDSDIILANSKIDYDIINKISSLYAKDVKCINYGLINLDTNNKIKQSKIYRQGKEKNIYFIDQVRIPKTELERLYVLNKLIEFADLNADKNIIIKSRIYAGEKTVHDNKYSYYVLIKKISRAIPSNIYFTSENIEDLYSKMDLCVSFSSTVILEALYYKIPVAVICDLGVIEEYATQFFLESDLLISFDDLILGKRVTASNVWLDENLYFVNNRDWELNEAISNCANQKDGYNKRINLFGGAFRFSSVDKTTRFKRKLKKFFKSPLLFFYDSKLVKFFR